MSLLLCHALRRTDRRVKPYSDAHTLMGWLDSRNLALWIQPNPEALYTSITLTVHRQGIGLEVVVASDGACGSSAVAYAAVLADSAGVFAEASSTVQLHDPYPLAAEWFGRYLGPSAGPALAPSSRPSPGRQHTRHDEV